MLNHKAELLWGVGVGIAVYLAMHLVLWWIGA